MLQKIQELITQLQISKDRSREHSTSSHRNRYSKKWTTQDQNFLCDLIIRFGTDFTLINQYFPTKTRKQIKKKYQQLQEHRKGILAKMEHQAQRERRKSFFDQEVLEEGHHVASLDLQPQSF